MSSFRKIEAWANGPVCRELFDRFQGYYQIPNDTLQYKKGRLSKAQRETVNAVIKYYRKKSSQYLSDLTHREDPWIDARKGLDPGERGNKEITPAAMEEYYGGL